MSKLENVVGHMSPEAGSAHSYTLMKRCPDGHVVSLNMQDEFALREHLETMWRYTKGYSLVAVVSVPNDKIIGGNPRKEQP